MDTTDPQPLRIVTAHDAAISMLRQRLTSGALQPGQPIRQHSLASELGISIVPMREALKSLESEGLVTYERNRGYSVTKLNLDDLIEAYRLRELLETEAVRQALPHLTAQDKTLLEEAAAAFEILIPTDDVVGLCRANRAFHFQLIEPCRMPRLIHFIRQLWDATDHYRGLAYSNQSARVVAATEHAGIVCAVRAGENARVVKLLRQHMHAVPAIKAVIESANAEGKR